MAPLDTLLKAFVKQQRMKIPTDQQYSPCYQLIQEEFEPALKN